MEQKISVNLSEFQKKELIKSANSRNISVAELIRMSLFEKQVISETPKENRKRRNTKINYNYWRVPIILSNVAKIISHEFGVSVRDIYSDKRHREIVMARHCLRYVLRHKLGKKSLEEIGVLSNFTDHSTIIHSLKTFSDMLETDKNTREIYNRVERQINKLK
jgi:chromosomal replication initiation ATPase DnaA